jgi:hypothetical protein
LIGEVLCVGIDADDGVGMDLAYALLRWMYGEEKVNMHFNQAEYAPHVDPSWDPYSRVFNVSVTLYYRDRS